MHSPKPDHDDRFVEALVRITRRPRARRELLWLHAKLKGQEDHARLIAKRDPGVRRRLARFYDLDRPEALSDPRERREAYEALYDEHYARLERVLLGPEPPR